MSSRLTTDNGLGPNGLVKLPKRKPAPLGVHGLPVFPVRCKIRAMPVTLQRWDGSEFTYSGYTHLQKHHVKPQIAAGGSVLETRTRLAEPIKDLRWTGPMTAKAIVEIADIEFTYELT